MNYLRYVLFFLIAGLILLFVNACSDQPEVITQNNNVPYSDSTWMELSLREKIGQVMCLNYDRKQIVTIGDKSSKAFFDQYPVGSFFMANWEMINYSDPENLADEYRTSVQELNVASPHPLLFAEDFETGAGAAILGLTPLTTAMGLGATKSEKIAYEYGYILGKEARSLGINWILNPVVDLNLNPYSFLTNVRSMGSDPTLVQQQSSQQIRAMQDKGVAATAKHFPGDGSDPVNQHFTTSRVKMDLEEWKGTFGKVFQNAIDSGVMCIMPGHISFPAFQKEKLNDEYLPATLSKELMTNLLKDQMDFDGVIVSDALNMAGIANYYGNDLETEIECFKAGADILLWPSLAFMDSVEARILRKEISMERLDDAVSRVWEMKKKLGLFEKDYPVIEKLTKEELDEHMEMSYNISKSSVTLISNKNSIIPLNPKISKKLLLVVCSQDDQSPELKPFVEALSEKSFIVEIRHNLSFFIEEENLDSISQAYDKIIFAFYAYPHLPWGDLLLHDDAALTMWSANTFPMEQVISVGFGDPYKNLIYMPRVWGRINAYAGDKITQQAVADLLVGEFEATGGSPVKYE